MELFGSEVQPVKIRILLNFILNLLIHENGFADNESLFDYRIICGPKTFMQLLSMVLGLKGLFSERCVLVETETELAFAEYEASTKAFTF